LAKIKDTDYLFLTGYIRAKEVSLLREGQRDRMLAADTPEEAAKVLEECGYGDMSGFSLRELEARLAARRADMMHDLAQLAPDRNIVDAFRIRYDYHNAKVIIKAEAVNTAADHLLSLAGRIEPKVLAEAYYQDSMSGIPEELATAMKTARDILATTGDPQLADLTLDAAYFKEFKALAEVAGSEFLAGYITLSIDAANLRTTVRTLRMGKRGDYLHAVLVPGGTVREALFEHAAEEGKLASVFAGSRLRAAAEEGERAAQGGALTDFERLCDNALADYLAAARYDSFSEKPLITYICAVEAEIATVRVILNGKNAGLGPDTIRERLRDTYV